MCDYFSIFGYDVKDEVNYTNYFDMNILVFYYGDCCHFT